MAQAKAVIWTAEALRMLTDIAAYISESSSIQKANQFQVDLITEMDYQLSQFPESCPPCRFLKLRKAGCRCCTFKKEDIVIYLFENGEVQIIGVVGARRNPKVFEDLVE